MFIDHEDQRQKSQSNITDHCKVGQVHMASIPAGRNGVDHIKSAILEGSDDEAGVVECIQECCKLGPNLCQYVWIFTGKCFAVGCTEENAHKCAPLKVSTLESSVYASIQYPSSSSSFSSQEQTGIT